VGLAHPSPCLEPQLVPTFDTAHQVQQHGVCMCVASKHMTSHHHHRQQLRCWLADDNVELISNVDNTISVDLLNARSTCTLCRVIRLLYEFMSWLQLWLDGRSVLRALDCLSKVITVTVT